MLRSPDISKDHIVFSYANDLWTVSRDGGEARPLASPAGREARPRFNADGTRIAFTGNYDGGQDLYVIPTTGGQPFRVTHHPNRESFCDWSGDQLLFAGYDYQGLGQDQKLYTVDADGGLPTELPIPYGAAGAIHSNGSLLAYTPTPVTAEHGNATGRHDPISGSWTSTVWTPCRSPIGKAPTPSPCGTAMSSTTSPTQERTIG